MAMNNWGGIIEHMTKKPKKAFEKSKKLYAPKRKEKLNPDVNFKKTNHFEERNFYGRFSKVLTAIAAIVILFLFVLIGVDYRKTQAEFKEKKRIAATTPEVEILGTLEEGYRTSFAEAKKLFKAQQYEKSIALLLEIRAIHRVKTDINLIYVYNMVCKEKGMYCQETKETLEMLEKDFFFLNKSQQAQVKKLRKGFDAIGEK